WPGQASDSGSQSAPGNVPGDPLRGPVRPYPNVARPCREACRGNSSPEYGFPPSMLRGQLMVLAYHQFPTSDLLHVITGIWCMPIPLDDPEDDPRHETKFQLPIV